MEWLKSLAPTLSALLTGSPLAGVAASMIAEKLGLSDPTVEGVTAALSGNALSSDRIASLKLAEVDMKKFMADNGLKLEELAAGDRKDARAMQVLAKSNMPATLTILITLGFFGVLGWMLRDKTAVESAPLLVMLGSLGTAWTGCCAFWFGTTSSSQKKTDLLAQADPIK